MHEILKRTGKTKFITNLSVQVVYPFKFKAWQYANGYIKIYRLRPIHNSMYVKGSALPSTYTRVGKKWSKFTCGYV